MIAIFDEDGGGDVDFQEFVSGLSAFSSKGNKEEKLRFAFKVYDIDRDGYISNGELFIVLKMMVGSNLKDMQLQQIVDKTIMEADLDGDGKISFEEFTRMVENTDVSMSMTLGESTVCAVKAEKECESLADPRISRSILGCSGLVRAYRYPIRNAIRQLAYVRNRHSCCFKPCVLLKSRFHCTVSVLISSGFHSHIRCLRLNSIHGVSSQQLFLARSSVPLSSGSSSPNQGRRARIRWAAFPSRR